MARIRSIHPGVYTDEAWASVSIPARWFAKGLCTEADDNGVFEWKPLQLKMRIFPADAVDVPALLAELVAAGIVLSFTADGRPLGAIRNFCRYQRPRKPKAWFPITEAAKAFVALGSDAPDDGQTDALAEPVPKKSEPSPPKSELPPQMEDGGGRMEEEEDSSEAIASKPEPRAKRASRRCPVDWGPSPSDTAAALALGLTTTIVDWELAKLRDFEFKTPRSDWGGVFRNWMRSASERHPNTLAPRPANVRPDTNSAKFDRHQANLERAVAGAQIAARHRALKPASGF